MVKSNRFSTVLTVVLTIMMVITPFFALVTKVSADAPELSFADIPGDSVTSDPNGVTVTFESDQDGYIIYRGQCVSETIEAVDGENSVTFKNVPENEYAEGDCQILVFNEEGDISDPLDVPAFTVDATAPKLSLTSVIDSPTTDGTPDIGIFLSEAAEELSYEGACDSSSLSAPVGASTLTLRSEDLEGAFDSGTYSDCKVSAIDEAGNESNKLTIPSFQVILPGDVYIVQTNVQVPSVAGAAYADFADETTRVLTLNVSHAGEIYTDATATAECSVYPNTVTVGTNKVLLTLDEEDYTTDDCILEYRVAVGSGDIDQADIVTAPLTVTGLPDLTGDDAVTPDIEENQATVTAHANKSSVSFTFTIDEGGTWEIVDRTGNAGTCSAVLTALVPLNPYVHPGVNTVVLESATGGVPNGTYGDGANTCAIRVTDGTISGNTADVNIPSFTINDNAGPTLTITKPVVSPVASGGAVVFRFTSNEFVDASDLVEPDVLLSGDCFNDAENTAWVDFATSAVIDDETGSTNEDIVTAGVYNAYNTFTILAGDIDDGTYSNCKFRVKDAAGNNSNTVSIPTFTVGASGPELENPSYSAGTVKNPVTLTFESNSAGTFAFTDIGGAVLPTSACKVNGYVSELPLKAGVNTVVVDNMNDAAATCYITSFGTDGRAGNTLTFGAFTVSADGDPKLSEVSEVNPMTLSYTFESKTGGTITYDGFCSSTTQFVKAGQNTITFNALPTGLVADNCEITVTSNDTADTLNVTKFTVQGTDVVTGPPGTVYRFFNKLNGAHLYTTSVHERDTVLTLTAEWSYEGIVYKVETEAGEGLVPVYRFWNSENGAHLYTISEDEKNTVSSTLPKFQFEGIKYYVNATEVDDTVPVYRFFNTQNGAHLYTISEHEKTTVETTLTHFNFEGVKYYVEKVN